MGVGPGGMARGSEIMWLSMFLLSIYFCCSFIYMSIYLFVHIFISGSFPRIRLTAVQEVPSALDTGAGAFNACGEISLARATYRAIRLGHRRERSCRCKLQVVCNHKGV